MFKKRIEARISEEEISERAYQIWQEKGCPQSDGNEDWQEAKQQLVEERFLRRRPLRRLIHRIRNRAAL